MIYFDSCALIKLVGSEMESDALQAWVDNRPDEIMVTSELSCAEAPRAIRRNHHNDQGQPIDPAELAADLDEMAEVLRGVRFVEVDRTVLVRAGELGDPMIRTLDAIHLTSALELNAPSLEFVTYDRRLARAAEAAGLHVAAPA